ncbi:Metalloenzyme, LuxS/M16 peptidase-like protein [Gongronella butleri]|nr:Metalloenzyme, LuxS/M16 peptidase-like protein [Gongronella butleri]
MTSTFATSQFHLNPFTEFRAPAAQKGFQKQKAFHVDPQETIAVTKYKSHSTGLSVLHVDVESPLVSGFLALATEALDDSGHPHTLEHLVFLGSQTYPYKGVLDSLAVRAFARGTNAWTDTDHTCYSVMTAGADGFLRFLPVYVDHILYPTLTESGFHTEIHHVDGAGEDAGVVYCEMKSRQNTLRDRLANRTKELVFPSHCSYRHQAGGKTENIRHLSLEKVRSYHAQFYRPDNLCIIISGKVDPDRLMDTLETIDQHIETHSPRRPTVRPWATLKSLPDIPKSITETVLFPDTNESVGDITMTWLGPAWNDAVGLAAIQMMHTYLSDSSISPLQRLLVETDQPLCTDIDFRITELKRIMITASMENVSIEHADKVVPMVLQHFNDMVANHDFDMKRMKTIIERERLKQLDDYENYPLFCVGVPSITDFIYGDPDGHDLPTILQKIKPLEDLFALTKQDWLNLLQRVYIEGQHVALIGRPSAAMAQELQDNEKERVTLQKQSLGKAKLAQLKQQLETANAQNELEIPSQLLTSFEIPDVTSISSIEVVSAQSMPHHVPSPYSNALQNHIDADPSDVANFIHFDHVRSPFVTIALYLNTGDMPSSLRPYGRLYMESFFSLPCASLPADDLVNKLTQDTIDYSIRQGRGPAFREYLIVTMKVEREKYEKAGQWLQTLLWETNFTAEKLKIACSKILNDLPQDKRSGRVLADEIAKTIHMDAQRSSAAACGLLFQSQFLPNVMSKLNTDASTILQSMNEFRDKLCTPRNMLVHVMGNIFELSTPKAPFNLWPQIPVVGESFAPANVTLAKDVLTKQGQFTGDVALIVSQPTMETSCSIHTVKGPSSFDSPDMPPLIILMEILHMAEGIFWRMVRGKGLAYDCYLIENIEAGLISLWILQSSDVVKAFEQIQNVMALYASGELSFDLPALDGAKSSVIYDMAQSEITRSAAGVNQFLNAVLRTSQPDKKTFLKAIQAVTLDDIHRVLHKYLLALFDPSRCNHVIVGSPAKTDDTIAGFHAMGVTHMREISMDTIYASS